MSELKAKATPRHLWILGSVGLLWTLLAATDFLMLATRNARYLEGFTAEQIAEGYSKPAWFIAVWTIAVWGGVLGAVLLLLRKRFAVGVLLLSLLCWAGWTIHYGVDGDPGIAIPFGMSLALLAYALELARKRVLA